MAVVRQYCILLARRPKAAAVIFDFVLIFSTREPVGGWRVVTYGWLNHYCISRNSHIWSCPTGPGVWYIES